MLTLVNLMYALAGIFSSHWFYPDRLEAQNQNVRIWNNQLDLLVSTYIGYKPLLFQRMELSCLDILQKGYRAHEASVCFSLVSLFFSCHVISQMVDLILMRK